MSLVLLTDDGETAEKISGHMEDGKLDEVAMVIARLGREGWEMTGVAGVSNEHCIYFKRRAFA